MDSYLFSLIVAVAAFLLGVVIVNGIHSVRQMSFMGVPAGRHRVSLAQALSQFFRADPNALPVVTRDFASLDLPNLHNAIQHLIAQPGHSAEVVGYLEGRKMSLFSDTFGFLGHYSVGPVNYADVDIDVGKQMQCIINGIYLITTPKGRIAAHLFRNTTGNLTLETRSETRDLGTHFIYQIRQRMISDNVFKGKMFSLSCSGGYLGSRCANVQFLQRVAIPEDEIILPPKTKSLIERNCLGFFRQAKALQESGHSLKRGVLLHGKPGTGKTLTTRWIAAALNDATVIVMAGNQLGLVRECVEMARVLTPALVIMEDVDLIAGSRAFSMNMFPISLNELLNEMDGVASEAPVFFLLTTNRPEVLEPALAERPGRVDQAIEYPLPDADCRQKLIELYARGVKLELADLGTLIEKTESASPAFIRELMRKSAFVAAEEGSRSNGRLLVKDHHCAQALEELAEGSSRLTQTMLGFISSQRTKLAVQPPSQPN